MSKRDIAIVGMACVFPRAATVRQYWTNLVNGVDAVEEIPHDRWQGAHNQSLPHEHAAYIPCSRGGFIPTDMWFDPRRYGVMPNAVRHGDADQFLMIHVVDQALRDAGITEDDAVRAHTDLIIGRGGYPTTKQSELMMRSEIFGAVLELMERRFPEMLQNGRREELESYLHSTLSPNEVESVSTAIPNIVASRAANRLNLRGTCFNVDAACASSLLAVEYAVSRLRSGLCDVAVSSGVFMNHTPTFWHVFTRLGALSQTGMIRPFDKRADGLVIGDGAGATVLKRLDDARRDGDQIYAVIKGVGSAGDGRSVDVLAPSSVGQIEALRRAYDDAGVDPASIGYLELHGTGTVAGDTAEAETIRAFFGQSDAPPTARCMGSVKSMIGHTMPAAGMASLIKTALSLSNKMIPPSLHCEQPRPEIEDATFFINTQCRPWVHNSANGPRRAAVNAFGFGGVNVHTVLEEVEPPRSRRRRNVPVPRDIKSEVERPTEVALFSADTIPQLRERLNRLDTFLEQDESGSTLADVTAALAGEVDFEQSLRLAIICRDKAHLRTRIELCLEKLDSETPEFGERDEIYLTTEATRVDGKVAFVFPGMGFPGLVGNYPDHLMELCLHYPEVRAEFDFFEQRDRHPDDTVPTSSVFWPPPILPEDYRQKLRRRLAPPRTDDEEQQPVGTPRPEERYLSAMGVTLTNWVSWTLLQKFQIPVDMIAGQSQGEMAAVCAAGCADFHATAPSYWKVLNVDWREAKGERMAFAWAPEEKVAPLLAENPGTHFAVHIGPEAVIFGGPPDKLAKIAETLREEEILVQILPYPPIHTPRLSYLRDELLDALRDAKTPLKKPQIPLYSSITSDLYPEDAEEIRKTLLMNLDHPLRIWQTVERMYADGARIFVQVGGGNFASSLETLLGGRTDILAVALDLDEIHPITQLNHLIGSLFTAGVAMSFDPLYEHRLVREIDLDAPQPAEKPPITAVPYRIDWSPLLSENVPPAREAASAPEMASETSEPDALSEQDAGDDFPVVEDVDIAEQESQPEQESHPVVANDPVIEESLEEPVEEAYPAPRPMSELAHELGMPFIGDLLHFVPGQELVMERMLDVDEDLFLHDHTFVHAPGIKPVEECLPIQPMTFGIELLAETAALLCDGKGLIGMENIRASRWIGLNEKPRDLMRIEAHTASIDPETGVQRVDVTVHFEERRSMSGTVLFGEEYRHDVDFEIADCSDAGPWPLTAEEVYTHRRMFHGPKLQVISWLHQMGNPSFTGELMVMPKDQLFQSQPNPVLLTDPCLMDGVGQFLGLWLQLHGWSVLPTGLEKLEFYGPTPPVGTSVPIRCELTELEEDLKRTKCNLEVGDGQGGVWIRIVGWSDWIFKWSERYAAWIRNPFTTYLSDEVQLAGASESSICCILTKQNLKKSDMDRAPLVTLHSSEMPEFKMIKDEQRQWQHVASRTAVKDAIRFWHLRDYPDSYLHPAMLPIFHDQAGRPIPGWTGAPEGLHLSISHSKDVAVAVVDDVEVGIDIEPISRDLTSILSNYLTPEENLQMESAAATWPGEGWPVRFWCAKEAVGKLLGTGLQGRPKDFEVIDVQDGWQLLVHHVPSGESYLVSLSQVDNLLIAYTNARCAVTRPTLVSN